MEDSRRNLVRCGGMCNDDNIKFERADMFIN